jgi:flagella basal body P-ring formation protein FlgA
MVLRLLLLMVCIAPSGLSCGLKVPKPKEPKPMHMMRILIAEQAIRRGRPIEEKHLGNHEIPVNCLIPEMILLSERKSYIGKIPGRDIRRDNVILRPFFSSLNAKPYTMVNIIKAKNLLPKGEPIESSQLTTHEIPTDCLLPEMVHEGEKGKIIGKIPTRDILEGRILLEPFLADPESKTDRQK